MKYTYVYDVHSFFWYETSEKTPRLVAEVIIPSPTFAMFEQAAESEGLVIRRPNFTKETPGKKLGYQPVSKKQIQTLKRTMWNH